MSEALYRKYRPKTFREVIGQEVIKTIIQNAVKLGRVSHAYLFTGPRGVGKTTVARLLAKTINCKSPKDGEPDTKCENCLQIQEGRFLDLLEIDAASYTGVDNIREIIDHVNFAPTYGRHKVFIIDEVHMLSKAAFNALLKTLEEPPPHAVFILATTEIHKVPATIISRSQRFDFRRVSRSEILELLDRVLLEQKIKLAYEAKVLLAEAAEGSFRDALSLLDQILSLGDKNITVDRVEEMLGVARLQTNQHFLDLLISRDSSGALKFVKKLSLEGKDLSQFTRNFLEYLRLVLLTKMDVEKVSDLGLTPEEGQILSSQSKDISGSFLLEIIKKVLEASREMKQATVIELPLMAAVLDMLGAAKEQAGPSNESISGGSVAGGAAVESVMVSKPNEEKTAVLDLGKIIDRWAEVLSRTKEYNHSLISSLRLGRLVRIYGLELFLAFPYNFHKEIINERKNRIVIEQVLEEIFGQKLRLKALLEREVEEVAAAAADSDTKETGSDLLGEAFKVLGS